MELKDCTRLFDFPVFYKEKYGDQVAYGGVVNGKWKTYTMQDTINMANKVSKALKKMGIKKGDMVALVSNNRPEWVFVDQGILQLGAVNVPVYPTITAAEYEFILNDSTAKYAFVSDPELYKRVASIKDKVPSLKEIFTFDDVPGAKHWTSILEEVTPEDIKGFEADRKAVDAQDLATLIYTSGTTGNPKGVMLTHSNLSSNAKAVTSIMPFHSYKKTLSFLPLCHSFERTVLYTYMCNGIEMYFAESMDTIAANLQEIKPDAFTTVPRLLEKIYEAIMKKGNELEGVKRKLFFWAIKVGEQYKVNTNQGFVYNLKLKIARKLIFSKWLAALGGNVQTIVTGAAAMNPKLGTLFTAAGIAVCEGYGLSETSPVISLNHVDEKNRRLGTIGPVLPGVQVKIAEDGEILAKGPNIMKGYYNRPDLTAEVIDKDGWFHTGDIGEFVDGKFLKITDRKKELFKTSGGKYVAPQQVENKYKELSLIEQIAVIGNNRKFVSALIVPSVVNLEGFCKAKGLKAGSLAEMVKYKEVIEEVEKEIRSKDVEINHVEQVKKFTLMSKEWGIDSGELTPTMKVKRRVLEEKFSKEIEAMYAN